MRQRGGNSGRAPGRMSLRTQIQKKEQEGQPAVQATGLKGKRGKPKEKTKGVEEAEACWVQAGTDPLSWKE